MTVQVIRGEMPLTNGLTLRSTLGGFDRSLPGPVEFPADGLIRELNPTRKTMDIENVVQEVRLEITDDVRAAIQSGSYRNRTWTFWKDEIDEDGTVLNTRTLFQGIADNHRITERNGTVLFQVSSVLSRAQESFSIVAVPEIHNANISSGVFGTPPTGFTRDTCFDSITRSKDDVRLGEFAGKEATNRGSGGLLDKWFNVETEIVPGIQAREGYQISGNTGEFQPAFVIGTQLVESRVANVWNPTPASALAYFTSSRIGLPWNGVQNPSDLETIDAETRFLTAQYVVAVGNVDKLQIHFNNLNYENDPEMLYNFVAPSDPNEVSTEKVSITRNLISGVPKTASAFIEVQWPDHNVVLPSSQAVLDSKGNIPVPATNLYLGHLVVTITYEASLNGAFANGFPEVNFRVTNNNTAGVDITGAPNTSFVSAIPTYLTSRLGLNIELSQLDLASFANAYRPANFLVRSLPSFCNAGFQGSSDKFSILEQFEESSGLKLYEDQGIISCYYTTVYDASDFTTTGSNQNVFNADALADRIINITEDNPRLNQRINTLVLNYRRYIDQFENPPVVEAVPIVSDQSQWITYDRAINQDSISANYLSLFYTENSDGDLDFSDKGGSEQATLDEFQNYTSVELRKARNAGTIEITFSAESEPARNLRVAQPLSITDDLLGLDEQQLVIIEIVEDHASGQIIVTGEKHSNSYINPSATDPVINSNNPVPNVTGYSGLSAGQRNLLAAENVRFADIKNRGNPPSLTIRFDIPALGEYFSADIYRDSNADEADGQQYLGSVNNASGFTNGTAVNFQVLDPPPTLHFYRVVLRNGRFRSPTSESAELNATHFGPLGTVNYYAVSDTPPTSIPPAAPWVSPEQYDANTTYNYIVRGIRAGDLSEASVDVNGVTSLQHFDYEVTGEIGDVGSLIAESLNIVFDAEHDTGESLRTIRTTSSTAGDNAGIVLSAADATTTTTVSGTTTRVYEDVNNINGFDITTAVSSTGTTTDGDAYVLTDLPNASNWSTLASAEAGAGADIRTESHTGAAVTNSNAVTIDSTVGVSQYSIETDAGLDDQSHLQDTSYWPTYRSNVLTASVPWDYSADTFRDLFVYTGNNRYASTSSTFNASIGRTTTTLNGFANLNFSSTALTSQPANLQNYRNAPDISYRGVTPLQGDSTLSPLEYYGLLLPGNISLNMGTDLGFDLSTAYGGIVTSNVPHARVDASNNPIAGGSLNIQSSLRLLDTNGQPIYDAAGAAGGGNGPLYTQSFSGATFTSSQLNSKASLDITAPRPTSSVTRTAPTVADAASGNNLDGIIGLSWEKVWTPGATLVPQGSQTWSFNQSTNDLFFSPAPTQLVNFNGSTTDRYMVTLTDASGTTYVTEPAGGVNQRLVQSTSSTTNDRDLSQDGTNIDTALYVLNSDGTTTQVSSDIASTTGTLSIIHEGITSVLYTNNHATRTLRFWSFFNIGYSNASTLRLTGALGSFVNLAPSATFDTEFEIPAGTNFINAATSAVPQGAEAGDTRLTSTVKPTIWYDLATDLGTIEFEDILGETWQVNREAISLTANPTILSWDNVELRYIPMDYYRVSMANQVYNSTYSLTDIPANTNVVLSVAGTSVSNETDTITVAAGLQDFTVTGTTTVAEVTGTASSTLGDYPLTLEDLDGFEDLDATFRVLGGTETAPTVTVQDSDNSLNVGTHTVTSGLNNAGTYTVISHNFTGDSNAFGPSTGSLGQDDGVIFMRVQDSNGSSTYDTDFVWAVESTTHGFAPADGTVLDWYDQIVNETNNYDYGFEFDSFISNNITGIEVDTIHSGTGTYTVTSDPLSDTGATQTVSIPILDNGIGVATVEARVGSSGGTPIQNGDAYGGTWSSTGSLAAGTYRAILTGATVTTDVKRLRITSNAPYTYDRGSSEDGRGLGLIMIRDSSNQIWEFEAENRFDVDPNTPTGFQDGAFGYRFRNTIEVQVAPNTTDGWSGGDIQLVSSISVDRTYTFTGDDITPIVALDFTYDVLTVSGLERISGASDITITNGSDTYFRNVRVTVGTETHEFGTVDAGGAVTVAFDTAIPGEDYLIALAQGTIFSITLGEDEVHEAIHLADDLNGTQTATAIKSFLDTEVFPSNTEFTRLGTTATVTGNTLSVGPLTDAGADLEPVTFLMEGPTNATLSFTATETDGTNQRAAIDIAYIDRAPDGFQSGTVTGTLFPTAGDTASIFSQIQAFATTSCGNLLDITDTTTTTGRAATRADNNALNRSGDLLFTVRAGNSDSTVIINTPTYTGATTKDTLVITVSTPNGNETGNLFDGTLNFNLSTAETTQFVFSIFNSALVDPTLSVSERTDVFFEPISVDANTLLVQSTFADELILPLQTGDFVYTAGTGATFSGSVNFLAYDQVQGGNFVFTVVDEPYALDNPDSYEDATRGAFTALPGTL